MNTTHNQNFEEYLHSLVPSASIAKELRKNQRNCKLEFDLMSLSKRIHEAASVGLNSIMVKNLDPEIEKILTTNGYKMKIMPKLFDNPNKDDIFEIIF